MRTSASQFQLLVEYMESHGDLSKPSEGPQGRIDTVRRWAELTQLLNADATGDTKTVEKWRKVWSDYKNNTKKKAARLYRAARGTGGGPALNSKLSSLEEKVLHLIGYQAATGIVDIPEVGLGVEHTEPGPSSIPAVQGASSSVGDWNMAVQSPVLYVREIREERLDSEATRCSSPIIGREPVTESALHGADRPQRGLVDGGVGPAARTPPPILSSGRRHSTAGPTPLPFTPRRRRRGGRVLHNPTSPLRRRTRTQTQSEQARQAFIRSDCEWRAFQRENQREKNRLREIELRLEERRLHLFEQLLVLGNRVVNILENRNVF